MKLLAVIAAATTAQAFAPTRATTPTVCRGGGSELQAVKNSAFVFVKPHAVTPPTIELVKSKLEGAGLTILSEGDISSEDIDQKKLVDQHYYAIASKATITPPAELAVPDDKFTEFFGESWSDVLSRAAPSRPSTPARSSACPARRWTRPGARPRARARSLS